MTVAVCAVTALVVSAAPPIQPPAPPPPPPPNRDGHHPAPLRPGPPPQALGRFGDPLPGLTTTQLANFTTGLAQFETVDGIEDGLGPIFNDDSCAACHTDAATGGGSTRTVTRFGRTTNGVFDPLTSLDGTLLHAETINPKCQEVIPPEANTTALRKTTPLFGAGLIEAIPDSAIQQLAKIPRRDGVKGQVAMVQDPSAPTGQLHVGRFGWKAQHAFILSFAGDAYVNEIGVTNRLFPDDFAPDGNETLLEEYEPEGLPSPQDQPDLVTGKADIDRFTDFMQLLAPPPVLPLSNSARAGSNLFNLIGCAQCHVPVQFTGPNAIAALNEKPVALFSDLLLHDMGDLNDGIAQAAAGTNQMKTAPLWGLRVRTAFLHDGSATTIDDAIRAHDGEAMRARDRYVRRSKAQQQQLIDFLNSI
jgi:CxxC motif-containing protein (DUF1111 family)